MTTFAGVYPALITPMTHDREGSLNEEAFRAVIELNIQAGVHGFWVAGGSGESVYLTELENNRIAEIVADQNQGRVNNIMHVGAASTAQAARQAEHAAKVGVEAICAVPPFFYGVGDKGVVEYYRVVGEAADLPLFAYNLPSATNVEITPELMQKIQDGVPQLRGLKHSSLVTDRIRTFADMGLDCFTGNGHLLAAAVHIGAVGVIDGPPGVMPEMWVKIWDRIQAKDYSGAAEAQAEASRFHSHAVTHFPGSMKALLSERVGMDCGDPRPPFLPLTEGEKTLLLSGAKDQGWL